MKKILLFFTILLLFGCILNENKKPKKPGMLTDAEESKMLQLKNEIESIKNNPEYYVGEGIATITDYQQDRKKAEDDALEALSKRIVVKVKSDIEKTLINSSLQTQNQYSENEKEIIVKNSKIYTDLVIENPKIKFYNDYPKKGLIYCLVWISVKEYEDKVKKDLNNKKEMIRATILNGDKNFISDNYLAAVQNWIMAKNYVKKFFNGLPLQDDINKDGLQEEVTSYLNNKILNFFANVKLNIDADESFTYDAFGKLNKNPMVYVNYVDKEGKKHPFAKLPLIADYIEGKGKVSGELITGDYGQVEIPIRDLDASSKIIRLRIRIDKDKIKFLNLFNLPALSSVIIKMTKMKTIALSITFNNLGNLTTPNNLFQKINSYILDRGFSVREIKIRKNTLNLKDFDNLNRTNADYFLNIYISAENVQTVGGYNNIFKTGCSGSVTLYKLPQGNKIVVKTIGSTNGLGSSANNAAYDGYGKMLPTINSTVQQILTKI